MYRPGFLVLTLTAFLANCGGDGTDTGGATGPTSGPPEITGTSPDPMIEGQIATISGKNFSSTTTSNTVLLDSVEVTVSAATATSLTITVPAGCGPARVSELEVKVFSLTSGPVSASVNPDPAQTVQTVSLDVGEQAIYHKTNYCFDLGSSPDSAQYLLGIQSVGTSANTVRGVTVQGIAEPGAASPARSAVAAPALQLLIPEPAQVLEDPLSQMNLRYRAGHTALMESLLEPVREPFIFRGQPSAAKRAPARVVVDGTENVGDQKEFRVRRLGRDCSDIGTGLVTAELRAKTASSMWWVDVDNPVGGFSTEQFEELGLFFDDFIYATEVAEYGPSTDMDDNDRIVIVMTKQINSDNTENSMTIGFVNPCDFISRGDPPDLVHTSNEGEFFYAIAPDPDSVFGEAVNPESYLEFLPLVIAHEFTHIIQFGRRVVSTTAQELMDNFISEGQATLSEEIVGHAVFGNSAGQNLDVRVALNMDSLQVTQWYLNPWVDLVYYFGWPSDREAARIEGAPQECTWIDRSDSHPCGGRALWYGVTWSLLRWLSDQYGDALGGEAAFQAAIIDGDRAGFDNLSDVLAGEGEFEDLLAQWAATLYMDDRPGAVAPLTMSSWDLLSVERTLLETAWLHPTSYGFVNFAEDVTIRDPSTAYFLVGGSGSPQSYTLRVSSSAGGDMSSTLQVWLVRTQ